MSGNVLKILILENKNVLNVFVGHDEEMKIFEVYEDVNFTICKVSKRCLRFV